MIEFFAGSLEVLLEFGYFVYTIVNKYKKNYCWLMLSGECKVVYVSKHSCPKNAYAIRDKVEHVSLTDEKLVPQANAFRYILVFFK